jgi:hypothetical protein
LKIRERLFHNAVLYVPLTAIALLILVIKGLAEAITAPIQRKYPPLRGMEAVIASSVK